MNRIIILFFLSVTLMSACKKEDDIVDSAPCNEDNSLSVISQRDFKMGFSTWSYGPYASDKTETYQFIEDNADIYSEQIDNKVPWDALINNTALPIDFVDDIDDRVARKISGHELVLSVSLLNTSRNDLLEDYDGTIPNYTALNDSIIEDAYYKHLDYLIGRFNPDYLIMAMEVNELRVHSEPKWVEYRLLMGNIRNKLKAAYPNLKLSESVTLHNWFNPDVTNPAVFIADISSYVNQNLDFAAISYYPFFKGQHTKSDFKQAFDFLHAQVGIPIAFVETNHLAENLEVASYNINIFSDVCEQKDYLESLLVNAHIENYEFVIWWAYRDYDKLWATFPVALQDIGKLWRDTGLLDEDGVERPAVEVWRDILSR